MDLVEALIISGGQAEYDIVHHIIGVKRVSGGFIVYEAMPGQPTRSAKNAAGWTVYDAVPADQRQETRCTTFRDVQVHLGGLEYQPEWYLVTEK